LQLVQAIYYLKTRAVFVWEQSTTRPEALTVRLWSKHVQYISMENFGNDN